MKTFYTLCIYYFTYIIAVRFPRIKKSLLQQDIPKLLDLKLCGKVVKIKLRCQDIGILFEVFYHENYKVEKGKFDILLDLGAHIGLVSLYHFLLTSESMKFVMVEPNRENFEMLKFNTKMLGCKQLFCKGLSDADEPSFIDTSQFGHNSKLQKRGQVENQVEIIRLDALLDQIKTNSRVLCKMDIEGSEEGLLRNEQNLSSLLRSINYLMIEFHKKDNSKLTTLLEFNFGHIVKKGKGKFFHFSNSQSS